VCPFFTFKALKGEVELDPLLKEYHRNDDMQRQMKDQHTQKCQRNTDDPNAQKVEQHTKTSISTRAQNTAEQNIGKHLWQHIDSVNCQGVCQHDVGFLVEVIDIDDHTARKEECNRHHQVDCKGHLQENHSIGVRLVLIAASQLVANHNCAGITDTKE